MRSKIESAATFHSSLCVNPTFNVSSNDTVQNGIGIESYSKAFSTTPDIPRFVFLVYANKTHTRLKGHGYAVTLSRRHVCALIAEKLNIEKSYVITHVEPWKWPSTSYNVKKPNLRDWGYCCTFNRTIAVLTRRHAVAVYCFWEIRTMFYLNAYTTLIYSTWERSE